MFLLSFLLGFKIFKTKIYIIVFSRSLYQIDSKLVKLDIDISDFFVLDEFQPEGAEKDILLLKFKSPKVLMTGKLGREILPLCKNGGSNNRFITHSNFNF